MHLATFRQKMHIFRCCNASHNPYRGIRSLNFINIVGYIHILCHQAIIIDVGIISKTIVSNPMLILFLGIESHLPKSWLIPNCDCKLFNCKYEFSYENYLYFFSFSISQVQFKSGFSNYDLVQPKTKLGNLPTMTWLKTDALKSNTFCVLSSWMVAFIYDSTVES